MLTTLLRPTSGTMLVDGADPVKDPHAVRRAFGIVFQDPSLDDDLTGWENMDLHGALYGVPRAGRRARNGELLEFVDLADRRDSFVREFSDGMKRRLEIARGLLHRQRSCFSTSRRWASIRRPATTYGSIFANSRSRKEPRSSSPRITWKRRIATQTPSRSSTMVPSSLPAREGLKRQTGKDTLGVAFLELTGRDIREEGPLGIERLRLLRRARGG